MGSRLVFKILLIILLILMAAPLLGALTIMASGGSLAVQVSGMTNGGMMGLAVIWIILILVLIAAAIASVGRSLSKTGGPKRHKAA